MLVATLPGPSKEEVEQQLFQIQAAADVIELRPDLYSFSNLDWVLTHSSKPILISGGSGKSEYLDIPLDQWPQEKPADVKLICSYHNFEETPENLSEILDEMQTHPADIFKICTTANSSLDGFRMLRLVRDASRKGIKIIGHCMGEAGQFTRVLGKIMGNYATYCTAEKPVAPGQMSLDEMCGIYSIRCLDSNTKIYALIGDPVSYSQGHIFHNRNFSINAVYVKIPVKKEELQKALKEMQELGFCGLSVTMPLKEDVGKYCNPPIKVCNTVKIDGGLTGINTDGAAAAALLKKRIPLKGLNVLIIGWGGTAKAIAIALELEGAKVVILNRTPSENVLPLCDWNTLDLTQFNVVVQATNVGMGDENAFPVDWSRLSPQHIALEIISNPIKTKFVKEALSKGWEVITGKDLFQEQAMRQYDYWGI